MDKDDKLEEFEAMKIAMTEQYELNLAEKEDAQDEMKKEHELYTLQLSEQIIGLEKALKEHRNSGDAIQKAVQAEHDKKLLEVKKQHEKKVEAKQEEIRGLSTEIETMKFEAIQKGKEIDELKAMIEGQKNQEQGLIEKMKKLQE